MTSTQTSSTKKVDPQQFARDSKFRWGVLSVNAIIGAIVILVLALGNIQSAENDQKLLEIAESTNQLVDFTDGVDSPEAQRQLARTLEGVLERADCNTAQRLYEVVVDLEQEGIIAAGTVQDRRCGADEPLPGSGD